MKDYNKKRSTGDFGTTRKDLYNLYSGNEELTFQKYKEIIDTFYKLLAKATIETGFMYKLPRRTGEVGIVKKKQKTGNLGSIDWPAWRETGELKRYTNTHTGGWYAKVLWNKQQPKAMFHDKGMFWLKPNRGYKKAIYTAIVDKNYLHKYFTSDQTYEYVTDEE